MQSHVFFSNRFGCVYGLQIGSSSVIVDSSSSTHIRDSLADLETQGFDLSTARACLLTHMHFDHSGGAAYIRNTLGIPVVCHRLAASPIVEHDDLMTAASARWIGWADPSPAFPIDYLVEDGDNLTIGDISLKVIHLPGHSRGCVGYQHGDDLYIGDVLGVDGGIGWCDLHWGSNLPDYAASLRRLSNLAPKRLLTGHNGPLDFDQSLPEKGLENVKRLFDANAPTRLTKRAGKPVREPKTIIINGLPDEPEAPLGHPSRDIRHLPLYEMPSGRLHGFIRPIGPLHGLNLFRDDGTPITRPMQTTMNLEHYCETGRCGVFTPRTSVTQSYKLSADTSTIRFGMHPDWQIQSSVTYTRTENDAYDIQFSFEFSDSYQQFEAFIASYFWGDTIPYVAAGNRVFRPDILSGQQLFFPKDDDSCRQVSDGRWDFLRKGNLYADTNTQNTKYDAPVTIHRDDETGWTFIQMVDPRMCSAVSVNTFAYAQDFSLIGRDVSTGENLTVRARVKLVKLDCAEDALDIYHQFQQKMEQNH